MNTGINERIVNYHKVNENTDIQRLRSCLQRKAFSPNPATHCVLNARDSSYSTRYLGSWSSFAHTKTSKALKMVQIIQTLNTPKMRRNSMKSLIFSMHQSTPRRQKLGNGRVMRHKRRVGIGNRMYINTVQSLKRLPRNIRTLVIICE